MEMIGRALTVKDLVAYQDGSVVSKTLIDKKIGTLTLFLFGAAWIWTVALKRSSLRYALSAGLLAGAALAMALQEGFDAPSLEPSSITIISSGSWVWRVQKARQPIVRGCRHGPAIITGPRPKKQS